MNSNYDALSGGVSAFGGLGRDFGRVGRLGALGRAQGSSGPAANTLVAGTGIFLLTGDAMTPLVDRLLPSAAGAFTETGQDVAFPRGYVNAADVGAFTLTGQAVTLTKAGGATARDFADINTYLSTSTTSRSFASFDHYVVA